MTFHLHFDLHLKKMVTEIYDDFDSQFELNKYEKKIMGIMTERLSEKIIIYLRTLE